MRIANFRDDVLWAVCYLLGLDPNKNLDDDQATALTSFINSWVRRSYDAVDYPEWTQINPFELAIPDQVHIVPYSVIPFGGTEETRVQIGRVFKVYLQDPQRTPYRPLETPFTLRSEGVHVGFEHGRYVWIKFIEQAPQFTSEVWRSTLTYGKGQLTYSPVSGQCYKSKLPGNQGHSPTGIEHTPLPTEIVQDHSPPSQSMPARNKIMEVGLTGTKPGPDPVDPVPAGYVWKVIVNDATGLEIAAEAYTAFGGEPLAVIAATLASQLAVALPLFVLIEVDDSDLAHPFIRMEDASDFKVYGTWSTPDPIGDQFTLSSELHLRQRQPFVEAVAEHPRVRQITKITLPEDMVMGDTVYSITLRSPDAVAHYVEYQGLHTDGAAQILTGLAEQIQESSDPWMMQVQPSVDVVNSVLSLSTEDEASVDAVLAPGAGNQWWKVVEFPFELIDQVVRGTYANALKEEGQTDKATIEEKAVPQEMAVSVNSNVKSGADRMTDQIGVSTQ